MFFSWQGLRHKNVSRVKKSLLRPRLGTGTVSLCVPFYYPKLVIWPSPKSEMMKYTSGRGCKVTWHSVGVQE